MAIQLDLHQSSYDVPFMGAYYRILSANLIRDGHEKNSFCVRIHIAGYAAVPTSIFSKEIDVRQYVVQTDEIEVQSGDTFLARCYEWVMAQPDMVGAIAV